MTEIARGQIEARAEWLRAVHRAKEYLDAHQLAHCLHPANLARWWPLAVEANGVVNYGDDPVARPGGGADR